MTLFHLKPYAKAHSDTCGTYYHLHCSMSPYFTLARFTPHVSRSTAHQVRALCILIAHFPNRIGMHMLQQCLLLLII